MRRVLHSAVAMVVAPQTYLRAVFVLVGAALALALGIAAFTVVVIAADAGTPGWALSALGVALVGGPLAAGLLPAVRQVEGAAAQTLLVVRFSGGPPGPARGWAQRRRALGWFLLHLLAGAAVVAAVLGLIALAGSWWTLPAAMATVAGTVAVGRLLAAAARKVIGRDPGFAEQALGAIETTSRHAAADLDHMLGLLRDDGRRSGTAPEPDLSAFSGLIEGARSAGLRVRATRPAELAELPVLVSREAYRIVQEGLTNALKYSCADRTVSVSVWLGGDVLHIRLTNPSEQRRSARSGRGVRGIRERVATLGGAASARIRDGQWMLTASLPTGPGRP